MTLHQNQSLEVNLLERQRRLATSVFWLGEHLVDLEQEWRHEVDQDLAEGTSVNRAEHNAHIRVPLYRKIKSTYNRAENVLKQMSQELKINSI